MRTITVYLNDAILCTKEVNSHASNEAVYDFLVSEGYSNKIVVVG